MTEFTPTTEDIRAAWREVRSSRSWDEVGPSRSWDEASFEFERWLDAHDQQVMDAVRPPVIPDDCNLVMAGGEGDVRRPWIRSSLLHHTWLCVTSTGRPISTAESLLIDPKPISEEER